MLFLLNASGACASLCALQLDGYICHLDVGWLSISLSSLCACPGIAESLKGVPSLVQVTDERILAVGATTAQLNSQLEAIPGRFTSGSVDANAALDEIARVVQTAQAKVAPAVAQLLGPNPTLTVQAFNATYSGTALTNLVSGTQQLVG